MSKSQPMEKGQTAVFVRFAFSDSMDATKIRAIAGAARPMFEGLPGLRGKVFSLDLDAKEAVNVYIWDSEEAARSFFTAGMIDRVAEAYGMRPRLQFAEIAGLINNG